MSRFSNYDIRLSFPLALIGSLVVHPFVSNLRVYRVSKMLENCSIHNIPLRTLH